MDRSSWRVRLNGSARTVEQGEVSQEKSAWTGQNGPVSLDRSSRTSQPELDRTDGTSQQGQVSLAGQTSQVNHDSSAGKGQPDKTAWAG
jgi:hypothetical protein